MIRSVLLSNSWVQFFWFSFVLTSSHTHTHTQRRGFSFLMKRPKKIRELGNVDDATVCMSSSASYLLPRDVWWFYWLVGMSPPDSKQTTEHFCCSLLRQAVALMWRTGVFDWFYYRSSTVWLMAPCYNIFSSYEGYRAKGVMTHRIQNEAWSHQCQATFNQNKRCISQFSQETAMTPVDVF